MAELVFPPINNSLHLGVRASDVLKNKYIYFIPRNIDVSKTEDEGIDKIFETTQSEIKKATTNQNKTSGDGSLYIALPLKAFSVDLKHTWNKKDVFVGNKAVSMLKGIATNLAKNAMNAVVESEIGQLTGLDKLKNTFLAQAGVAEYKPQRNLYEKSETEGMTFSWTLSPRNKDEALLIYKITKAFQFFSMPQEPGSLNNAGSSPFFVKSPALWRIRFSNDSTNPKENTGSDNLPKHLLHADNEFSHMVITDVSLSFGGDGDILTFIQKANQNSFPVETVLSVTFDYYMDVGSAKDFLGFGSIDDILNVKGL